MNETAREILTGQWGSPQRVLLDLSVDADGRILGVVNPGSHHAIIRSGHFDASSNTVMLAGEHCDADGEVTQFRITGVLDGRTLRVQYRFGDRQGTDSIVRADEYRPPRLTIFDRAKGMSADLMRVVHARSRPTGARNASDLRARGEDLDSIVMRQATAADIPELAGLHVELWNRTYRTTRGPTVAIRTHQWQQVFARERRRDFLIVLADRHGRLIGFTWGIPDHGEFKGQISKIYLRWEYHGLGLGRRMMQEAARRFLERGIDSVVLFAERSNPTIGFYDRMGGERLTDEKGQFHGAYCWRDVRTLLRPIVPATNSP